MGQNQSQETQPGLEPDHESFDSTEVEEPHEIVPRKWRAGAFTSDALRPRAGGVRLPLETDASATAVGKSGSSESAEEDATSPSGQDHAEQSSGSEYERDSENSAATNKPPRLLPRARRIDTATPKSKRSKKSAVRPQPPQLDGLLSPANITSAQSGDDTPDAQARSAGNGTSSPSSILDAANRQVAKKSALKRRRTEATTSDQMAPRKKQKQRQRVSSPPTSDASAAKTRTTDASFKGSVKAKKTAAKCEQKASSKTAETRQLQVVLQEKPSFTINVPKISSSRYLEVSSTITQSEYEASQPKTGQTLTGTSRKGKSRAGENIQHKLPVEAQILSASSELDEDGGRTGFATTTARRGPRKSKAAERDVDSDDAPARASGSESSEEDATGSNDESSDDRDTRGGAYKCTKCRTRFRNERLLQRHLDDEYAHKAELTCLKCHRVYKSIKMLAAHERKSGHGKGTGKHGKTGKFTEAEKRQLMKFRDRFCAEHGVTATVFNDMMTASSRSVKDKSEWVYPFITRDQFLADYYSVLPDRNKRSMLRYRERHFQNVEPATRAWTEEDDDELVALVEELGPKWVHIGQRLSRTQDAVHQRWRNKLQHRDELNTGEWTPPEVQNLKDAVTHVRQRLKLPKDGSMDHKISWTQVSKELQNRRTAQQCAGKWDRMTHRQSSPRPWKVRGATGSTIDEVGSSKVPRRNRARKSQPHTDNSGEENELATEMWDTAETSDREIQEPDKTPGKKIERDLREDNKPPKIQERTPRQPQNSLARKNTKAVESPDLSQAFQTTQANTSALRPSASRVALAEIPVSSRPSPDIDMRMRPLSSSPLDYAFIGEDKNEKRRRRKDRFTIASSQGSRSSRPAEEDVEISKDEDEEADRQEAEAEELDKDNEKQSTQEEIEESATEYLIAKTPDASIGAEESDNSGGDGSEDAIQTDRQQHVAPMQHDSDEEDQESSDAEDAEDDTEDHNHEIEPDTVEPSETEDESDESQGTAAEEEDGSDDEVERVQDSVKKDTKDIFMANINYKAAALTSRTQQQQRLTHVEDEEESTSSEDSDSDSDSDVEDIEDIEHG